MSEQKFSQKEAMIYSQRVAQMSKALWKAVEKDWQQWIKPYDLNINEHHILWIAYHLQGATISDVAKFGVMHVSTAFNFSKKLEERGYLEFFKKEDDRRNTYIAVTEEGEVVLQEMNENYYDSNHGILEGSLPIKSIYGKFPEFLEVMSVIRNIYGEDFMEIFEQGFKRIDSAFDETDGELISVTKREPELQAVDEK
ncbi:HTH-type transcriptional regulator Hpr [Sporosarcina thermotolerans]|uniref:HTH-type transcriptional regulator Hpr n=1 Tax=Sporosarcina thermotolerans TaxID=633404 RepID=A0AAW9ACS0_9BACL|nr:HTH-type transcriptional regulator Hpr [Sporosarcina thermotolerans]MDW0118388.1 HTH-type transcriptional regulator Hpr [Sporosarcina thermotolerans]WHT49439.1 HTH-type transcriptional regulator Hpr [Sporosarcina thermotolerans]